MQQPRQSHNLLQLPLLSLLQVSDFPLGVIFGVCSIFLACAAGKAKGRCGAWRSIHGGKSCASFVCHFPQCSTRAAVLTQACVVSHSCC